MKRGILIGILFFFIGLVIFFPYATVRDRVLTTVSKETGVEIFPGPMHPTLQGIGVSVRDTSLQYFLGKTWKSVLEINVKQFQMYVPWMSLFKFSPHLLIKGVLEDKSQIWSKASYGGGFVNLEAKIRDVDFVPYLEQVDFDQVELTGKLGVDLKIKVRPDKGELGKTDLVLQLHQFMLGALEFGGFSIPSLSFVSPVEIVVNSKDGKDFTVKITMGATDQDPLKVSSEGKVRYNAKRPHQSSFVLKNTIQFSKTLEDEPSVQLLLPLLDQFKKPDGSFNVEISGNFGKGVTGFPKVF